MSVYEHVLRLLTPAKEWTEEEKETVRLTPACIDVPSVLPRIYPSVTATWLQLRHMREVQNESWAKIGETLGRLPTLCRSTYRHISSAAKPDRRTGRWTDEEHRLLSSWVAANTTADGHIPWSAIGDVVAGRCSTQCCRHWSDVKGAQTQSKLKLPPVGSVCNDGGPDPSAQQSSIDHDQSLAPMRRMWSIDDYAELVQRLLDQKPKFYQDIEWQLLWPERKRNQLRHIFSFICESLVAEGAIALDPSRPIEPYLRYLLNLISFWQE